MECGHGESDSCATHVGIDGGEMKLDGFMIVCDGGGADSYFFYQRYTVPCRPHAQAWRLRQSQRYTAHRDKRLLTRWDFAGFIIETLTLGWLHAAFPKHKQTLSASVVC